VKADLHIHSSASDGADSPTSLIEQAAAAGLDGVALTDHDTLAGIAEASEAASRLAIALIPGVELSVDHHGSKMHMLVYGIEPGRGPLQDRLDGLRTGRLERNTRIVAALQSMGYDISLDDVERQAMGPSIGRPHIADALIAEGYFGTRDEAFEHLLHDGGAAYFPRVRLSAGEAIELGRASGGVPVVAHPKTIILRSGSYIELFSNLASLGLGGIEAHHPTHDTALRAHLEVLAGDLSLIATGGSDFHGETKRKYRIGTGSGDLRVPSGAFEAIASAVA